MPVSLVRHALIFVSRSPYQGEIRGADDRLRRQRIGRCKMKLIGASILVALVTLFPAGEAAAQTTVRMNPNQRLDKGQKIELAGKGFLIMQTDGNLVLYDAANQPKWA